MNSSVKRTPRDYSQAFKLSVVDQVEKAISRTSRPSSATVPWVTRRCWFGCASMAFRAGVWHHLAYLCRFPSLSGPDLPQPPEQKIKALEVQLREANEKARFFEAVLDVLKKDYGCVSSKNLWESPRAKVRPGAERVEGLPLLGRQPPSVLPITAASPTALRMSRYGARVG